MRTPLQSNPLLLNLLDELALYLHDGDLRICVAASAEATPARQWLDLMAMPGEYEPIIWGDWVACLRHGVWPDLESYTIDDLTLAVKCFPCNTTRGNYKQLAADPLHQALTTITRQATPAARFRVAHKTMLVQLCQSDRQYFALAETLGVAWFDGWATRAPVAPMTLPGGCSLA